jgi:hypothetical protein
LAYESVDKLQRVLADSVFAYAADRKKAAGRALGTLVEIITYYTLRAWGFRDSIAIERPLAEFANPAIAHNVEYSLHPILWKGEATAPFRLPISASRLRKLLPKQASGLYDSPNNRQLLSRDGIVRNCCDILELATGSIIAHLDRASETEERISFVQIHQQPFAIFECKRVGIEEGMRKGPQTIEKAKQGAYVARAVSSLQKIRLRDGSFEGVIPQQDGTFVRKPYDQMIADVIASDDPRLLEGFILTVGVASNHGNWFTSEDHNKEMRVLAQSYDWLLFLTDVGLSEFIERVIMKPSAELEPARVAFQKSYASGRRRNRFTKVQMDQAADQALQQYFERENVRVRGWFNVINPAGESLDDLHRQLDLLRGKNWRRIKGL